MDNNEVIFIPNFHYVYQSGIKHYRKYHILMRTTWCFKCKIELGKQLYDIVTCEIDPSDDDDGPENSSRIKSG